MPSLALDDTNVELREYFTQDTGETWASVVGAPDGSTVVISSQVRASFGSDSTNGSTFGTVRRIIIKLDLTGLNQAFDYTSLNLRLFIQSYLTLTQGEAPKNIVACLIDQTTGFDYNNFNDPANWAAAEAALQDASNPKYQMVPSASPSIQGNFVDFTFTTPETGLELPTSAIVVAVEYESNTPLDPFTDFPGETQLRPEWGIRVSEQTSYGTLEWVVPPGTVTPTILTGSTQVFDTTVTQGQVEFENILVSPQAEVFDTSIVNSEPIAIPTLLEGSTQIFQELVDGPHLQTIVTSQALVFPVLSLRTPRIVGPPVVLPDIVNAKFDDENVLIPLVLQTQGHEPIDLSVDVDGVFFDVRNAVGGLVATAALTIVSPQDGRVALVYNNLVDKPGEYPAEVRIEWASGVTTLAPTGFNILRLRAHA